MKCYGKVHYPHSDDYYFRNYGRRIKDGYDLQDISIDKLLRPSPLYKWLMQGRNTVDKRIRWKSFSE